VATSLQVRWAVHGNKPCVGPVLPPFPQSVTGYSFLSLLKFLLLVLTISIQTTDQLIDQSEDNKEVLTGLFQTLNLLLKIFFDLNCQDLPPQFETNIKSIMTIFHKYLAYTNPLLNTDDDEESGPLERVKAAICEVLVLYTHKYEDVFEELLPGFVSSTWMLLTSITLEQKYDIVSVPCRTQTGSC